MAILTHNKNIFADGVLIQPRNTYGSVAVVATSIVSGREACLAEYKAMDDAVAAILELFKSYQSDVQCTVMSDKGRAGEVLL